jgi:hypothetical protein
VNKKFRAYRSLLIAVLLAISLAAAGPSQAHEKGQLILDVVPNGADFSMVPDPVDPNQGPFYVSGTIFAHGSDVAIGEFHCWGYFAQGGSVAVVSQEFNLDGRGKIQVQGVEDDGPRAVVGGTGDFRNVRGEAQVEFTASGFTAAFKLKGAKRSD